MNKILIIGAGRSASALIEYVLSQAKKHHWEVTVADADLKTAQQKVNNHPNGLAVKLDIHQENNRKKIIGSHDLVVSMLPAHLHIEVAYDCVNLEKHLITASYQTTEMYRLSELVKARGLIFMGEMGLDPGIDHMSAMQIIHELKDKGAKIKSFRSYTGGLIAPESDDNPWHYKFTWNPRNVVNAGKGTAQFLKNFKLKYIPYHRLFQNATKINVPGMGEYEMYPNRDSLLYREAYGLEDIPNIVRGTIRHVGYCEAWAAMVRIGLTDGSFPILHSDKLTYRQLMEAYVREDENKTLEERIADLIGLDINSAVMKKLQWLGLFEDNEIDLDKANPALILENLLLGKWRLRPEDKDMIIMQHEFEYELNGAMLEKTSTMVMKGKDSVDTAMSRMVGLPLGIFVKLVMLGKITTPGVNIPVTPEVYNPVLKELEEFGLFFKEKEQEIESFA